MKVPEPVPTEDAAPTGSIDSLIRLVAAAPASQPPIPAGTIIDETFRIEGKLGAGGMGVVYRATDLRLHRQVALKLHAGAGTGGSDPERSLREAKVMARLSHPNVIAVYEVGSYRGQIFIVMELVDGATLRTWLSARPRRRREILDAYLAAARGLAAAHEAELVHRDFKPDNVLVGRDGAVRVADFGLAGEARPDDDEASAVRGGTPAYMAPEQRAGQVADARSDQYSFCAALREALTGAGRVPRGLRRLIDRGLDPAPARRWPGMPALIARLEQHRRRGRLFLGAGGAAALASAGIWIGAGLREAPEPPCGGAKAELRGVWDATRTQALRRALAASASAPAAGAVGAAETGAVISALEGWATSWVGAHEEACRATRVRGERSEAVLDARMACLARGRAALDATVEALVAEPPPPGQALHAVGGLPASALCLLSPALLPPPAAAERARELDEITREVARARVLIATSRFAAALATAARGVERARRAGYAPVTASALRAQGNAQGELGRAAETLASLDEAAAHAVAGGDDPEAVRAISDLAFRLAERGLLADAERWYRLGFALLERLGNDAALFARLASNQVPLLVQRERLAEAEQVARRAVERSTEAVGPAHELTAQALQALGAAQGALGRLGEARASLSRSLAVLEGIAATDYPLYSETRKNLARVELSLGEHAAAEANIRRVLDADARTYGKDLPRLADAWDLLGALRLLQGDPEGSRAARTEALRLAALDPSLPDEDRAMLLGNMGITYAALGRLAEAHDHAARSLAAFERAFPPESGSLVAPRQVLGTLERYLGRAADAQRTLAAASALAARTLPEAHPVRLNTAVELAITELALGRAAEAVRIAEPAVAALERAGHHPMNVAEARFALARSLRAAGRAPARAAQLAAQAREGYAALGPGYEAQRQEIDAWLARGR